MRRSRRSSPLAPIVTMVLASLTISVAGQGVAGAVEGSWAATGSLNIPRIAQESVLMTNGRVLVTGGRTATASIRSTEYYDPLTETFSFTGAMSTDRWSHTATLLRDGRVLVAGGFTAFTTNSNAQPVTDTAEIYDPRTEAWTPTPPMNVRRALHTATLLDNGQVLVAGGRTCTGPPPAACDFTFRTNTAELYDPATNRWTPIAPENYFRHTTSAVELLDGRVLVPAGFSAPDPHDTSNTADLYNPATGIWITTGDLNVSRARQGAMLLHDGTVLVGPGSRTTRCGPPVCNNGGPPFSSVIVDTSEIFNPATLSWQFTAGKPLLPGRFNFQQAVLPSGKALMAGGFGGPAGAEAAQRSAELYNPATGTWESAGNMTRVHGTSSSLANTHDAIVLSADPFTFKYDAAVCGTNCGKVLVVGDNLTDGTADLYTPAPFDRMTLTKSATPTSGDAPLDVAYTYSLVNNGTSPIHHTTVTDNACGPVTLQRGDTNNNQLLDPGENWTFTCSQTLTSTTTNTATADGTSTLSGLAVRSQAEATVNVTPLGPPGSGMTLAKSADRTSGPAPLPVTYTYTLANTGTDPLHHATVTDNECSPVTLQSGDTNNNQLLDPGETWILRCQATITATTTNTAVANAISTQIGLPVRSLPAQATVNITTPMAPGHMTLSKTASRVSGTAPLAVTYTYTLLNDGTDPLHHTTVTDDACGPVSLQRGDTNNNQLLDPGETWILRCQATLDTTTTNRATANGTSTLSGLSVASNPAQATVVVRPRPGSSMTLAKSADPASGPAPLPVTYTYTLANSGTDPLHHATVTDNECGPVTLQGGDTDNDQLLDPGETWTYRCSRSVTATTTNTAVANATSTQTGLAVRSLPAQATVNITTPMAPGHMRLSKSADHISGVAPLAVTYTYTLLNDGTDPLHHTTVTDDRCGPVTLQGGDTNNNQLLDPGETWTLRCQATLDATTTNTATANGTSTLSGLAVASNPAQATVVIRPQT